jgi:hypothetical protein
MTRIRARLRSVKSGLRNGDLDRHEAEAQWDAERLPDSRGEVHHRSLPRFGSAITAAPIHDPHIHHSTCLDRFDNDVVRFHQVGVGGVLPKFREPHGCGEQVYGELCI